MTDGEQSESPAQKKRRNDSFFHEPDGSRTDKISRFEAKGGVMVKEREMRKEYKMYNFKVL